MRRANPGLRQDGASTGLMGIVGSGGMAQTRSVPETACGLGHTARQYGIGVAGSDRSDAAVATGHRGTAQDLAPVAD